MVIVEGCAAEQFGNRPLPSPSRAFIARRGFQGVGGLAEKWRPAALLWMPAGYRHGAGRPSLAGGDGRLT
jgi:hypothetical protein